MASIEVRRDVRIVASRVAGPDIGGKNADCENKAMTGAVDIASIPLCEKGNGILNTK